MKHIWKRNQIIITALVIMVGVAGYLNFTDNSVKETLSWQKNQKEKVNTAQPQMHRWQKKQRRSLRSRS